MLLRFLTGEPKELAGKAASLMARAVLGMLVQGRVRIKLDENRQETVPRLRLSALYPLRRELGLYLFYRRQASFQVVGQLLN